MSSRKPIDGTKPSYIDKEGYVVDENFRPMPDYKNDDGHRCIKIAGEEREIRRLVYTHFSANGKGAEIPEGKAPQYKGGDPDNCAFDNLVMSTSKEDIVESADPEDEVQRQIIELFVEDSNATYDDVTERMKERHDEKVSRNQIADAKKLYKAAKQEAGQV